MTHLLTFKNITIGITLLMACIALGAYLFQGGKLSTQAIHLQYPADFSDDRILVGAAHVVFVAKVVERAGEEKFFNLPSTQFKVEVIENIKGNLDGQVVIDQLGGYRDGVLYLVDGDVLLPAKSSDSTDLLQSGSTYLFAARYNEANGQYVLITHPNALKLLSSDAGLDSVNLSALVSNDEKVMAFKDAYKNEVLLEADMYQNNTRNSYESLKVGE